VYDARVRDEPITTRARTMSPSLPAWLTSRPKALGARRGAKSYTWPNKSAKVASLLLACCCRIRAQASAPWPRAARRLRRRPVRAGACAAPADFRHCLSCRRCRGGLRRHAPPCACAPRATRRCGGGLALAMRLSRRRSPASLNFPHC
jgi:hypothetical protein